MPAAASPAAVWQPPAPVSTGVRFEYTGATGMTVRGPITGRTYRFNGPGIAVEVDSRDAPSMMAVPKLRRA